MKQISLTQGKVALVDDDIYELIKNQKWCANRLGNTYYALRNSSRKDDPEGKQHPIFLHWLVVGEPLKGFEVDHKDGNGLNNQRNNLKIVTRRKNQQNRIEHRKGQLSGCYYNKDRKKWQAQITINGIHKGLGRYATEQEAHDAYLNALGGL